MYLDGRYLQQQRPHSHPFIEASQACHSLRHNNIGVELLGYCSSFISKLTIYLFKCLLRRRAILNPLD